MSDSEDEHVLLDEQSMDEVHELEDALQVSSVDTNASQSPTRRRPRADADSGKSDSSSDMDSDGDDDSISDSSEGSDGFLGSAIDSTQGAADSAGASVRARSPSLSGSESDEPPEIPGSPLAQKGDHAALASRSFAPSHYSPSVALEAGNVDVFKVEEDEYEAKEYEQPRAMEFHTSSSSESESDEEGDSRQMNGRSALNTMFVERPKTAAKELEQYRDAVPEEFFQQIEQGEGEDDDYELQCHTETAGSQSDMTGDSRPKHQPERLETESAREARSEPKERAQSKDRTPAFKVHVPAEVQELFSLVEAYTPEEMEIGTRLEPFLPELMPVVGLPYDGIEIPRPDGQEDAALGVEVVREAEDVSNTTELELLMQVALSNDRKMRSLSEAVRSIDDAARRPKVIDQWIASVSKAHASKPLPQVYYKKPMPTMESLMELWPEEFEQELNAHAAALDEVGALSSLSLSLKEMATLVCVLLDIPVYDGLQLQSLHALFSLYDEIHKYEQQQQQQQQLQHARYP